ncbi:MAG: alanine racemase [Gemmatimonadota bacterium]
MSTDLRSRAWVEINGSALHRNMARVAGLVGGGGRVLPVVKSNAYGLGLGPVLRVLERSDPWGYGVAEVREAEAIRTHGVTRPVLILNPLPPGDVHVAVAGAFELSVSSMGEVDRIVGALDGSDRSVRLHAEVDTGMGRAGFDWREVGRWGPDLIARTSDRVEWTGLFTHFHSASDPDADAVTVQSERFAAAARALSGMRAGKWVEHLCNSSALFRSSRLAGDLVRPGIFLYGGRIGSDLPAPESIVSLRARIVLVREVPPGTTLGYGATYRATRPERWATVAIGYGDGLPRCLGNRGQAVVAGRRVRIVGRISMGLTVVDITDLPEADVRIGDEATFLGRSGTESISVDEVAGLAGTISYEILTGLSARLPRLWSSADEPDAPDTGIQ